MATTVEECNFALEEGIYTKLSMHHPSDLIKYHTLLRKRIDNTEIERVDPCMYNLYA